MVEIDSIIKAIECFKYNAADDEYVFANCFESLGADITLQATAMQQNIKTKGDGAKKIVECGRLFRYSTSRISDVMLRLKQIQWMRDVFCRGEDNRFDWISFTSFVIKDFHSDLSSLMDSIAPAIIHATCGLKKEDLEKLPGFADIQKDTQRSYRKQIPVNILNIIDSTDRWWKPIKEIRDILVHRKHLEIVFSNPDEGIFFQVYTDDNNPKILETVFLVPNAHNVADFELYGAFIVAEIITFLENLGNGLIAHMGRTKDSLTGAMRTGNFDYFVNPMRRLAETINASLRV